MVSNGVIFLEKLNGDLVLYLVEGVINLELLGVVLLGEVLSLIVLILEEGVSGIIILILFSF